MSWAMVGRLEACVLLSYSTPGAAVRHLLPDPLCLTEVTGRAFWSVMTCRLRSIRPAGLPAVLGVTYHHVAYRLHVSATLHDGSSLSGITFVRSDADSKLVVCGGNLLTALRLHPAAVELAEAPTTLAVSVRSHDGLADADMQVAWATENPLKPGSVFASVTDRDQTLRYAPLALSVRSPSRLGLVRVVRNPAHWVETPVEVHHAHWSYLVDTLQQHDLALERAVTVAPIDYRWELASAALDEGSGH